MTDTLTRLVRTVILAVLALVGMGMALLFMVSTAIAVGVLYIVARVQGKPLGARTYWSQRRAGQAASPFADSNPFTRTQVGRREVVDVQARKVR